MPAFIAATLFCRDTSRFKDLRVVAIKTILKKKSMEGTSGDGALFTRQRVTDFCAYYGLGFFQNVRDCWVVRPLYSTIGVCLGRTGLTRRGGVTRVVTLRQVLTEWATYMLVCIVASMLLRGVLHLTCSIF